MRSTAGRSEEKARQQRAKNGRGRVVGQCREGGTDGDGKYGREWMEWMEWCEGSGRSRNGRCWRRELQSGAARAFSLEEVSPGRTGHGHSRSRRHDAAPTVTGERLFLALRGRQQTHGAASHSCSCWTAGTLERGNGLRCSWVDSPSLPATTDACSRSGHAFLEPCPFCPFPSKPCLQLGSRSEPAGEGTLIKAVAPPQRKGGSLNAALWKASHAPFHLIVHVEKLDLLHPGIVAPDGNCES